MGTLIVIREAGVELGTLLWEFEGDNFRVAVNFNCAHEMELRGVVWYVHLEVCCANYPEEQEENWWQWTEFERNASGLTYRASWLVCESHRHPELFFRALARKFAENIYYYRSHEEELRKILSDDKKSQEAEIQRREEDRAYGVDAVLTEYYEDSEG